MLDTSLLNRSAPWSYKLDGARLLVRQPGRPWFEVGTHADTGKLHEFFGVRYDTRTSWQAVCAWFFAVFFGWYYRRLGKRLYQQWFDSKHKRELATKRERHLAKWRAASEPRRNQNG